MSLGHNGGPPLHVAPLAAGPAAEVARLRAEIADLHERTRRAVQSALDAWKRERPSPHGLDRWKPSRLKRATRDAALLAAAQADIMTRETELRRPQVERLQRKIERLLAAQ